MPLSPTALKRAQEAAKEELGTPLDKEPGQEVAFWLVRHDDFERAVADGTLLPTGQPSQTPSSVR